MTDRAFSASDTVFTESTSARFGRAEMCGYSTQDIPKPLEKGESDVLRKGILRKVQVLGHTAQTQVQTRVVGDANP